MIVLYLLSCSVFVVVFDNADRLMGRPQPGMKRRYNSSGKTSMANHREGQWL